MEQRRYILRARSLDDAAAGKFDKVIPSSGKGWTMQLFGGQPLGRGEQVFMALEAENDAAAIETAVAIIAAVRLTVEG